MRYTDRMKMLALSALVTGALLSFAPRAGAQTMPFSDVPANHWAAPAVARLANAGIVIGYGSSPLAPGGTPTAPKAVGKKSTYDGAKPVTRYELATTLYRFIQYMERVDKTPKSKTGAFVAPPNPADSLKKMVAGGYLSANLAFVKNAATAGGKSVTADEFAAALGDVLTKIREKKTPVSRGSEPDIPKPAEMDGAHGQ